ncbi:MAG: DUF4406 domain-containing protein [Alloprevotella sp.]
MEKKKIYLSGKVSGENYEEVRKEFDVVQEMLEEVGHEVFNPIVFNEELHGGDTSLPWQEYMLPMLPHIAECDIIYLMYGWHESYGAQIERLWAERCGLEIIYQDDEEVPYSHQNGALYYLGKYHQESTKVFSLEERIRRLKFTLILIASLATLSAGFLIGNMVKHLIS